MQSKDIWYKVHIWCIEDWRHINKVKLQISLFQKLLMLVDSGCGHWLPWFNWCSFTPVVVTLKSISKPKSNKQCTHWYNLYRVLRGCLSVQMCLLQNIKIKDTTDNMGNDLCFCVAIVNKQLHVIYDTLPSWLELVCIFSYHMLASVGVHVSDKVSVKWWIIFKIGNSLDKGIVLQLPLKIPEGLNVGVKQV